MKISGIQLNNINFGYKRIRRVEMLSTGDLNKDFEEFQNFQKKEKNRSTKRAVVRYESDKRPKMLFDEYPDLLPKPIPKRKKTDDGNKVCNRSLSDSYLADEQDKEEKKTEK